MLKVHSGAAAAAAALFVCAIVATPARDAGAAAQFAVDPLRLTLPANKLATALTLGNEGSKPVTVQVELVSWSQQGSREVYGDPAGLIVSPPIFSIAPRGKQIVRIGRAQRTTAPARELAYRVVLTEVPPKDSDRGTLATVMQLSVPLFVPPASKDAKAAITVKNVAHAGNELRIEVANAGLVHGKIVRLTLRQDGKTVAEQSLNNYVLAETAREIVWAAAARQAHAGPAELTLEFGNRRTLVHPVTLQAPPPPPAPPPDEAAKPAD